MAKRYPGVESFFEVSTDMFSFLDFNGDFLAIVA